MPEDVKQAENPPQAQPSQQEKPDTVRRIFVERMKREGRAAEWFATIKQVMMETGKRFGPACPEAMKRMGYEGPKREWEIHEKYVAEERAKLKTPTEIVREQIREEIRIANFEEALASLPPHCSLEEEKRWIASHPAMSRRARSRDNLKDIVITAEDIYPPHGKAPSQSAVHALQHWANHAHEFYKTVYTPAKKMSESEGGGGAATRDVGISDIERLLDNIVSHPAQS